MSTHATVVRRIILAIAVRSARLIGATAAMAVVPPIAFPTATR
jgi:phosphoribosylcarboxyaminoimidazole (NCAIR) mutase